MVECLSMHLRSIKNINVHNKRVFLRVDFNVPLEDGKIKDDFRIKASEVTIGHLLNNKARIILATHWGRPKDRDKAFSAEQLAKRLSKHLKVKVKFVADCIGHNVNVAAANLKPGEILMLENLRYYEEEEENDERFAFKLASFSDLYINDAFSVSHRKHASVNAITHYLPSYAGFLLEREVDILMKAYNHPKKPLVIVIGGAKAGTKIKVIKRFFGKADHILLGGVIANVVLAAKGVTIGKSKIDQMISDELKDLDLTSLKLHLPIDVVVAKKISENVKTSIAGVGNMAKDDIILDIGPSTIDLFSHIIESANTVIWNGPLGYSEMESFSQGTNKFAEALCASNAFKIIGGGESIMAIEKMKLLNKIDFVSTGGGAMLDLLAGEPMPGLEPLIKK